MIYPEISVSAITRYASLNIFRESLLPTEETLGYTSTVGIYGGRLKKINGSLVMDMTGPISWIDQNGDALLRRGDEHIISDPWDMFRKHPSLFIKQVTTNPLRYRGTKDEIEQNINRLGLSEIYALHPKGIEIRRPEIFTHGYNFQDIWRQSEIGNKSLMEVDRYDALGKIAFYMNTLHKQRGPVGEFLDNDIFFQKRNGIFVEEPILNIPDIVYSDSAQVSDRVKKAIDILDLLTRTSFAELNLQEGSSPTVDTLYAIYHTFLRNYGFDDTVRTARRLLGRGWFVMSEEGNCNNIIAETFSCQHNTARLGIHNDKHPSLVRYSLIRYLDSVNPKR